MNILDTVKHVIGSIDTSDHSFDEELLIKINSEFFRLYSIGIPSDRVYHIENGNANWEDLTNDPLLLSVLPDYIGLRVKMNFDPPQSSSYSESIKSRLKELEWKLYLHGKKCL